MEVRPLYWANASAISKFRYGNARQNLQSALQELHPGAVLYIRCRVFGVVTTRQLWLRTGCAHYEH
jgi:hypothetical protein